jgi:hypothetical protein
MVVGYDEGLRRKLRFGKKEVSSYIRFYTVQNHKFKYAKYRICVSHTKIFS